MKPSNKFYDKSPSDAKDLHCLPRQMLNMPVDYEKLPSGAIGLYTYYERLAQGLRQLMAGCRKFTLKHVSRDDIVSLTRDASEISQIPYVMDLDKQEVQKILNGKKITAKVK